MWNKSAWTHQWPITKVFYAVIEITARGETHDPPQVEDIPTYGEREGQHEVDLNFQRLNNCWESHALLLFAITPTDWSSEARISKTTT